MSWAHEPKTSLTPQEVLMVAHAHLICGVDQHRLSAMFGVNPARVAEAVLAMRWATEHHKQLYREEASA